LFPSVSQNSVAPIFPATSRVSQEEIVEVPIHTPEPILHTFEARKLCPFHFGTLFTERLKIDRNADIKSDFIYCVPSKIFDIISPTYHLAS
jgi:hypothetical protein